MMVVLKILETKLKPEKLELGILLLLNLLIKKKVTKNGNSV